VNLGIELEWDGKLGKNQLVKKLWVKTFHIVKTEAPLYFTLHERDLPIRPSVYELKCYYHCIYFFIFISCPYICCYSISSKPDNNCVWHVVIVNVYCQLFV
jgi:hypothetical protein